MAKHRIYFQTIASTSIEVEVPDEVTDPEEIAELAEEQADFPTLCHQCTGGTRFQSQNLELGDEWEPLREDGKPVVESA